MQNIYQVAIVECHETITYEIRWKSRHVFIAKVTHIEV